MRLKLQQQWLHIHILNCLIKIIARDNLVAMGPYSIPAEFYTLGYRVIYNMCFNKTIPYFFNKYNY